MLREPDQRNILAEQHSAVLTSIDFGSGIPGLNLCSIVSYLCDLGQILSLFTCKMDILVSTPHYFIGCCAN